MINFGTWTAHGLRVVWAGGLANPDVLAQGCEVILENARGYTPVKDPFAQVVLVLRPAEGSRVAEYSFRPVFGKDTVIFATDTLSALRGLAQYILNKYRLPGRADSLIIPSEGAL